MKNKYLDINFDELHATREAFGQTLIELADEGLPVFAVDADLSGSTTTKKFGEKYPNRFVNCGIAEQNMIDIASGLSLDGNIVYTGSFAMFGVGRCYEQIRNTVCYSNLNVKISPTHSGISVGPDGGSHQMIEDLALMSVIPNMRVLCPCDKNSCASALRLAAAELGPFYTRMGRAKVAQVYNENVELELGGSNILREGSDCTIVACGVEVSQALKSAERLATEGIECTVVDAYCIKPLDEKTILECIEKTSGRVVVCEEHSIYGGLCEHVARLLAEKLPTKAEFVAIKDRFGTSGEMDELFCEYGIDSTSIDVAVKREIESVSLL